MRASGAPPLGTFVVPRFTLEEPKDELDFGSVWEVANEVRDVNPPARDIASDWSSIASGWVDLGVEVRRMALAQIADAVAPRIDRVRGTEDHDRTVALVS